MGNSNTNTASPKNSDGRPNQYRTPDEPQVIPEMHNNSTNPNHFSGAIGEVDAQPEDQKSNNPTDTATHELSKYMDSPTKRQRLSIPIPHRTINE